MLAATRVVSRSFVRAITYPAIKIKPAEAGVDALNSVASRLECSSRTTTQDVAGRTKEVVTMKAVRFALCAVAVIAALLAPSVRAIPLTVDQSDLWYIQAESGWGMQLVQRNSTIFATLFVYDPAGNPTWYVATMTPISAPFTWSGDLYATTGPWFGTVPFNPANVTATKVGTMTWTAKTVETGNVAYTVNGAAVSKDVVRETLVYDDYSGHYGGGIHSFIYGCMDPALNGTVENMGVLDITQNGQSVTLESSPTAGGSCSYDGTQTQSGQMGIINGSYTCTDGTEGTFHLFGIQVNMTGITGRFFARNFVPEGCLQEGWFGGLRVTTF
jgi:hypothetical protein